MVQICDYSDTDYRQDFWKNGAREYEDAVERYALRKLFPLKGESFIDIGAGFGRLMDEYAPRFREVTVFDYAPNLLAQARDRAEELGFDNVSCCQGDLYNLTGAGSGYDGCMMVRVLHHVEDVPAVFSQVNKILRMGGFFILEYANKRNFLEIARMLIGQEHVEPFDYQPSRRGEGVFYNFHPAYIEDTLSKCGFVIERELMTSLFRSNVMKKVLGHKALSTIENYMQSSLGGLKLSPSVFLRVRKVEEVQ